MRSCDPRCNTFAYGRGGAVLTGEDELLFILEITGSCQRRREKGGLSSGELARLLVQRKGKVCRDGGSCENQTANMQGCREEMGNWRETAGGLVW